MLIAKEKFMNENMIGVIQYKNDFVVGLYCDIQFFELYHNIARTNTVIVLFVAKANLISKFQLSFYYFKCHKCALKQNTDIIANCILIT